MTVRYWEERECEHGQMNSHNAIRLPSGEVVDDVPCPGGQRRELTGVKVVETQSGFLEEPDDPETPFLAGEPGRYAIIPLEA